MSAWEAACRERIEQAQDWDLTLRQNRRELGRWKRRLWRARNGAYLSAGVGVTIGVVATQLVMRALGWGV